MSLGGKFGLPIKSADFPLSDLIVDIKECLKTFDDDHRREVTQAKQTNILSRRNRNNYFTEMDRTLLKIHEDCVSFLRKNKYIIIVKADKGGCTLAMLREDYNEKMTELLSDTSTYSPHNSNPAGSVEKTSNGLVASLAEEKIIDEQTRRSMVRYNTHLARIYALPKIHKTDVPLRPIVSTIDCPSAALSKYMDKILRCLVHDKYDVLNRQAVKQRLNGYQIGRNETLISFDIVSLFPSIPMPSGRWIW